MANSVILYSLKFIYSGERCRDYKYYDEDGIYHEIEVKDLSVVWENFPEYKKEDVYVLDDSTDTYILNKDNAIPIEPYYGDLDDKELDRIAKLPMFNDI